METLATLTHYINRTLDCDRFDDYGPNGLQVQGKAEIQTLITGVTASVAFLDAAIAAGADAVLVHHGYFWKGESPTITGMRHSRISRLIKADVSLLAYHLPLDAHIELGNNAQLGKQLGLLVESQHTVSGIQNLLWQGRLSVPMSADAFVKHVSDTLGRNVISAGDSGRLIEKIAWCSGGAQRYIHEAAELGCDAFLSGEIREQTTHEARELGLLYLAAGHHATERYGVQALGAHLDSQFAIDHRFINIDNPA